MPLTDLHKYLNKCISEKIFPGCVCWIGGQKKILFFEKYGHAQLIPQPVKMQMDTIFDLASLTKPMVTALSIMMLHERGLIDINDPVAKYLPSLKNAPTATSTIKELMIHTSGLRAWYPVYMWPADTRLDHMARQNTGEHKVVYSCLGYIMLGKTIEMLTHTALDRFFRENISAELSLDTIQFGPVQAEFVAATEHGNVHEKQMASQYGDPSRINWRTDVIRGEVHDGNAYYAFDNVAGNAGLFSSTEELAALVRAYLHGDIVTKKTLRMMTKDHTGGEEKRGFGWKMEPYPGLLSPASFGHTGFTGTMIAVDPGHDLIIILLANAVHPEVKLNLMNPIRQQVVRIISKALGITQA
jgi:CubicO group peptidase (beta-lactamase class C family)